MTNFDIPIHAKSEEELNRRIMELEARGFEVLRRYSHEKDYVAVTNTKYKSPDGKIRRTKTGSSYTHYGAVMRRDNTEYLKQKGLA